MQVTKTSSSIVSSNYKPLQTGGDELRNHLRRSNESDKSKSEKVASAKNTVVKDEGFKAFAKSPAASDSDTRVTEMIRRSRRFDQVLDESEFGAQDEFESNGLNEICAPIQCDEEDDGPDFSRMAKKKRGPAGLGESTTGASLTSNKAKKGDDIRKRFMIERPKGSTAPTGMLTGLTSGGSNMSQMTASTD